ncbi:hypothetical protein BCA33_06475 [Marinobacter sp. AC-23]|nr:hypothetical protein BCA33_06475 [Marinobacter sp. AC-23]
MLHDKIIFVQPTNCVGPPAYGDLPVFQQDGRVVILSIGQCSNPVGKRQSLGEILEFKRFV